MLTTQAYRNVGTPNPDWTPGSRQRLPYEGTEMIQLDPAELGADLYPFVISAVVPRLVCTAARYAPCPDCLAGCLLQANSIHLNAE